MNVTTAQMNRIEADKQYKKYRDLVKTRKNKEYNELRKAYRAMSKGYKLIDIYQAFEDTGLDANGRPRLAIVKASSRRVWFEKRANLSGFFTARDLEDWRFRETMEDVRIPANTFKPNKTTNNDWEREIANEHWSFYKNRRSATNVPIVPAHLLPDDSLENYYILFEVEKWSAIAAVQDPYLLKRVNANTFIVMAEWDVSPVEAMVMRGR